MSVTLNLTSIPPERWGAPCELCDRYLAAWRVRTVPSRIRWLLCPPCVWELISDPVRLDAAASTM